MRRTTPAESTRPSRSLRAWLQLLAGLVLFGIAVSLMIRSNLGLGPWDAFHVGLHNLTGVSIGAASIAVGLVVVVGTALFGLKPGPGTALNIVAIGILIDVTLPLIPVAPNPWVAMTYYLASVTLFGLATGMYIGAGLGTGPRDGLMIVLSDRTGWPIRRTRFAIEVSVLFFGWLMGGNIGIGTLIFALTIGPATHWGLNLFGLRTSPVTAGG